MASAISGFETEKRPTGLSKLITRDWPTRTFTGTDSLFSLNDALYDVSWAWTAQLKSTRVKDASSKLNRRVAVLVTGENLCMIGSSFLLISKDHHESLLAA